MGVSKDKDYPAPNDLLKENTEVVDSLYEKANEEVKTLRGSLLSISNKLAQEEDEEKEKILKNEYELIRAIQKSLIKYKETLKLINKGKEHQVGEGIRNKFFLSPHELLKRFELTSGSLVPGNNGVLPEYFQIAHRLKDLGIITNNQLNSLLRNYLNIR